MRRLAVACVLAVSLGTGCDMFVSINEELNWGQEQLDKYAVSEQGQANRAKRAGEPPGSESEAEDGEAGAAAAAAARRTAKSAAEWWGKATTLAPADKDPSIVQCDLAGSVQFMREADCRARGGRPS